MLILHLLLNNHLPDTRAHKAARSAVAAGHDAIIYALWKPGLEERETIDGYRVRRIKLTTGRWKGRLFAPVVKFIEFTWRFLRETSSLAPGVIHAHDAKTLPLAWIASREHRTPILYDARELETGRNFGSTRLSKIYQTVWAWPEKLFIHSAAAVITVSPGIARRLADLYHIPTPAVIRNLPDAVTLAPSARLRAELHIPPDQKILLYQGGVTKGRGIEPFVAAIQQVPGVAGVVLGSGALLPALQARVNSGELQRIYLPGWVHPAELPAYTASADAGMVTIENNCQSHYLSLPNKLFESIQAGIPVIASDLPEIARIVTDYGVGVLMDPEKVDSVVAGIHHLLDNPDRYQAMKAAALRARDELTWQVEFPRLLSLYQEVVGGRRS